ncbi:hypothetical protein FQA47_023270 [Oryzias melastigma]|uniref:Uncharacterized protein n=1 Tax=Oryzias melastigma TaxID=30732 RepID=A0A834BR89_ORYME|nr:hypothetical protein FQA47_023270 [Oryzias melastigma]
MYHRGPEERGDEAGRGWLWEEVNPPSLRRRSAPRLFQAEPSFTFDWVLMKLRLTDLQSETDQALGRRGPSRRVWEFRAATTSKVIIMIVMMNAGSRALASLATESGCDQDLEQRYDKHLRDIHLLCSSLYLASISAGRHAESSERSPDLRDPSGGHAGSRTGGHAGPPRVRVCASEKRVSGGSLQKRKRRMPAQFITKDSGRRARRLTAMTTRARPK